MDSSDSALQLSKTRYMALAGCLANDEEISEAEMQCILNETMLFIDVSPQTDYNTLTYPGKFTSVAMPTSKKPLC